MKGKEEANDLSATFVILSIGGVALWFAGVIDRGAAVHLPVKYLFLRRR